MYSKRASQSQSSPSSSTIKVNEHDIVDICTLYKKNDYFKLVKMLPLCFGILTLLVLILDHICKFNNNTETTSSDDLITP